MTTDREPTLCRIVSGGQTGVDRAALDAAIAAGLEHGGACPRGRRAEDGVIPERYRLVETESAEYHVRTERNVVESDATLILHRGGLRGGTRLTRDLAVRHRRPLLCIDLDRSTDVQVALDWIRRHRIGSLNVAGPRESSSAGIGLVARRFMDRLLARGRD